MGLPGSMALFSGAWQSSGQQIFHIYLDLLTLELPGTGILERDMGGSLCAVLKLQNSCALHSGAAGGNTNQNNRMSNGRGSDAKQTCRNSAFVDWPLQ